MISFVAQLSACQRKRIECSVDMWEPFRLSMKSGFPGAASSTTSSTSCSKPTTRWTRCGGQSSSVRRTMRDLIKEGNGCC